MGKSLIIQGADFSSNGILESRSILDWCVNQLQMGMSWNQYVSGNSPISNSARCCLIIYPNTITDISKGFTKIKIKVKDTYNFVFGTGVWDAAVTGSGWFKGNCEPAEFAWITDTQEAVAPLDFPLSENFPRANMFKVNIKKKDGTSFSGPITIYDIFDDITLEK